MSRTYKPTIKVTHDFLGQDYVCETTHHGNTTVKRNFPIWRGLYSRSVTISNAHKLMLQRYLKVQSGKSVYCESDHKFWKEYSLKLSKYMKNFFLILAVVILLTPFAIAACVCIAAPLSVMLHSVGESNPDQILLVTLSYSSFIYLFLTRCDGFALNMIIKKMSSLEKTILTVMTVCYIFSFIGYIAA